ncbi:hypothetical protein LMG28138_01784 [Pararobbsia alpina]|uniref:Uncharacterized protein n=1 Tax=Pararobbsia alpina TaxID=621374 RepID=A0A6S7B3J9_9BURK|nr:hypothetical protein LMG28138_01784 [Pararobbsia alpina]
MDFIYRAHEWLADRISWVQYPKPRVRSVSGHALGFKARWQTRPPMNKAFAICLPTLLLFVSDIGVYLSIASVIFLFAYFNRRW